MLFQFLIYLRPTWYFNLKPHQNFGAMAYFPTEEQLAQEGVEIFRDAAYVSPEAQKRDQAWTAFQKGYIDFDTSRNTNTNTNPSTKKHRNSGLDVWQKTTLPIVDEYRFLRKNFHSIWVFYVLILRLLSFKNPIRELSAYRKTRNQKRVAYHKNPISYPEYDTFKSKLLVEKPLVTVIIPTLNRYDYLEDVFADLEAQEYKNFEVIVVDQSEDFREDFYKNRNLNLTYWYQEEKALWKARNEAVKRASGEYILLYDDDSRVESDWIAEHLKTLDFFDADLSGGVSLSVVGGEIPDNYSYFRWNDQLDTGNVLLKKNVFHTVGLFDRQFEKQRMGDAEFGLRAYLAGFKNISNPYAKRIHLKVSQGGLREMGSWDAFRTKNLFAPRPVPSVLYLYRKYFGRKAAVFALLKNVPPAIAPYKYKKSKPMKIISSLLSVVLFPLVLIQVFRSWKLASKKLKEGARIEEWE